MRLRSSSSNRLFLRPNVCHSALFNPTELSRKYTQIARKDEEVKYDQRRIRTDYGPAKFDHREHLNLSSECVWRLVDKIPELKLIEVAELGSIMMKKVALKIPLIVDAMKGRATAEKAMPEKTAFDMGAMKGKATVEEAMPEKTVFALKLEAFDASAKLKIIKEFIRCRDLGLKEARYLVENLPSVFKKNVSKEEGEKIIEKMKVLGAKVVMEQTVFDLPSGISLAHFTGCRGFKTCQR